MTAYTNRRLISTFKSLSNYASLTVITVGLLVLFGWVFSIPMLTSGLPGPANMKVNSALAFALAGFSLWLASNERENQWMEVIAKACATFSALIGLLTLSEYVFNQDFGIDQLLFKDTLTAACFCLAGPRCGCCERKSLSPMQSGSVTSWAGLVFLLGMFTLAEYVFRWDLGIDQFMVKDLAATRKESQMNSTRSYWNGFAIATLLALMACTPAITPTSALIPVTIQLSWTHSSQFAGYYAADQLGYYTAEGLAVTFIEGGPTVDRLKAVLDSSAQFGLASGINLIEERATGNDLVAIAAILRRDPFAFFTLASSGITRPQDFVGKVIQIRVRAHPYLYPMLARVGVTPEQITEANDAAFDDLYTGKVDVGTGFVTAQLVDAQRAGYKLNVINPDDYGIHSLSDLIFATDTFIAQNHDLSLRFLRATLKGWTYAVENPVQAAAFVAKYKLDADISYETAVLTASLPYINTGEDHIGWMKPEIWIGMEQTLREQGVITKPVDVTEIYTLQFLNEIYKP